MAVPAELIRIDLSDLGAGHLEPVRIIGGAPCQRQHRTARQDSRGFFHVVFPSIHSDHGWIIK